MYNSEHTVNGTPNLDSFPKVSSGNDTPISEIASFCDEMPIYINTYTMCYCTYYYYSVIIPVIEPIQPVQPMLANGYPLSDCG